MTRTVLIVDDVLEMRSLLRAILTEEKFQIMEASSSKEALEILSVPENKFDLILLDILLSDGESFNLIKTMKTLNLKSIPKICMVTGLRDRATVVKGLQAGADDFVVKPIDVAIFLDKVRSLLGIQRKSNLNFVKIKANLPASVSNIPIPLTLTLTEISEISASLVSEIEFKTQSQFDLKVDYLCALAKMEFVLSCKVVTCKKNKTNFLVEVEFMGLNENVSAKIREITMKGKPLEIGQ